MGKEIQLHLSRQRGLSLARSVYDAINQESFNGVLPNIPMRIHQTSWLAELFDYEPRVIFTVEGDRACLCTIQDGKLRYNPHNNGRILMSIDNKVLYFADASSFLSNLINHMHHEMIHEYCYLFGLDECDRYSQYHNEQFMSVAEDHGLICDYDGEYGFQQTTIQDDLLHRILNTIKPSMGQ